MKAILLPGNGQADLVVLEPPVPAADEVLLKVRVCGVCGTDRHLLDGSHPHGRFPIVPGHEFVGTVVDAGSDVLELGSGDRVVVNPAITCDLCEMCRLGRPNLCARKGGYGIGYNGGLAEFAVVRERFCHRLPDGMPDEVAALSEPLACAVHAVEVAAPQIGNDVLILGAGPLGLLVASVLRHAGATDISMVDINDDRAAVASEVSSLPVATSLDDLGTGRSWDLVFEATGSPRAVEDGFGRVSKGGKMIVMGVAPHGAAASFSLTDLVVGERTIHGSFSLTHTISRAVELLAGPLSDLGALVTDTVPLEGFASAIAALGEGAQLKTLITLDD
jgi:2-desacetyl-2-hydroxyethyl bacteriochlorophyllide A dehydrogenase